MIKSRLKKRELEHVSFSWNMNILIYFYNKTLLTAYRSINHFTKRTSKIVTLKFISKIQCNGKRRKKENSLKKSVISSEKKNVEVVLQLTSLLISKFFSKKTIRIIFFEFQFTLSRKNEHEESPLPPEVHKTVGIKHMSHEI